MSEDTTPPTATSPPLTPEVPTPYAQGFDQHVNYMLQTVLEAHGEWATHSHMAWLHRKYSQVLVRSLELDRREQDLIRREAAFQQRNQKSRRSRKAPHGTHGGIVESPA